MDRKKLRWSLLCFVLFAPALARAGTSVDLNIRIGDAPPPPVVIVREEPALMMVPGTTVYVCDDHRVGYDCFRYGVYWYVFNDGYWYRARGYRGPFVAIQTRYVPRAVINVPPKHWRRHPHGGPPGQMKKHAVYVGKEKGKKRDRY